MRKFIYLYSYIQINILRKYLHIIVIFLKEGDVVCSHIECALYSVFRINIIK